MYSTQLRGSVILLAHYFILLIDHSRNRLNFDLNKSRQKFHHSLKDHHKISNIPKLAIFKTGNGGSGNPGIGESGNRGIRESGNPGIGESGNPGIRESGNPIKILLDLS